MDRRTFLKTAAVTPTAAGMTAAMGSLRQPAATGAADCRQKPKRLAAGDTVVLVAPANGMGRWDSWSVDYLKRVLFNAEAVTFEKLAGVLEQIRGFVFGTRDKCEPGEGYGSLTLEEVLDDHIGPLNVPTGLGDDRARDTAVHAADRR